MVGFEERVAVVTRGAGGIAAAVAWRLAETRATVAVADLRVEAAVTIAKSLSTKEQRGDVDQANSTRPMCRWTWACQLG